jgi:inorganic triphosphatase YgiF
MTDALPLDRDHVEAEVKLGVELPDEVRRLVERPPSGGIAGFVPSGPVREATSLDRYIDTAERDGALDAIGLRARLRDEGGEVVLGVKDRGSRDGDTHSRRELEGRATSSLDPADWHPSHAREVLVAALGGLPPIEIARLAQRRLKRRFRRGATEVEISLDTIEALDAEGIVAAVRHEIEAELITEPSGVADALDDLADLARALRELPGVGDSLGSKLSFARSVRRGTAGAPPAPGTFTDR